MLPILRKLYGICIQVQELAMKQARFSLKWERRLSTVSFHGVSD